MIIARNLSKAYREGSRRVQVLTDVTLIVKASSMVAVRGVSGSGKTTLLNILACLDHPDGGDVIIAGENVTAKSPRELSRFRQQTISLVLQRFNLLTGLTALENVMVPLKLAGIRARDAIAREDRPGEGWPCCGSLAEAQ